MQHAVFIELTLKHLKANLTVKLNCRLKINSTNLTVKAAL